MGLFSSKADAAREQWRFMNEKDERLKDREKEDWRREKARLAAERKKRGKK